MSQPYPAAKLDQERRQIRLVTILPGSFEGPIACELSTTHVDDLPEYNSLSYVWGQRAEPRQILLNGRTFDVTRNVEEALRRLRHPTESRVFWIDMICIDQSSSEERTHQVNLMGLIYSRAREVFIWLGDYAAPEEHVPFDPAREYKGNLREVDVIDLKSLLEWPLKDKHLPTPLPSHLELGFRAFEKFVRLSWWYRMWTVQESLLPTMLTFAIGGQTFPWDSMSNATVLFDVHRNRGCCIPDLWTLDPPSYGLIMTREFYHMGDSLNLSILFDQCRLRKSADPRDKIFALLGIVARDPMYRNVQADYKLANEKALTNAITSLILCEESLYILIRPREKRRELDLPTWVPDLSADVDEEDNFQHLAFRFYSHLYQTSKGIRSEIDRPDGLQAHGFKGLLVDQVDLLREDEPVTQDTKAYADDITNLCHMRRTQSSLRTEHNDLQYEVWRLIMMDAFLTRVDDYGDEPERVTFETYSEYLDLYPPRGIPYWKTEQVALYRFFITKSGYVGLGPKDMRVGDAVHVLLGGDVPFILRKTERHVDGNESQPTYEYIGHCYVQGIMYGEALEDVDISKLGYVYLV